MLFILEDPVFKDANASVPILALLNQAATSSLHLVMVRDDKADNFRIWLSTLSKTLQQQVQDLLNYFARRAASGRVAKKIIVWMSEAEVQDGDIAQHNVTLVSANQLVNRSFRIYVENSRNDKRFFFSACTEEQRDRLVELERNQKLQFVHGGGITELNEQLRQEKQDDQLLSDYSWALFDSDALLPGCPSNQSVSLANTCKDLNVKFTQLKFRAIENYIPKTSLRSWVYAGKKKSHVYKNRVANFLAYVDLSDDISRHYNMKKGIAADRKRGDFPGDDAIYAGLSIKTMDALLSGFGSDVSKVFEWGMTESDLKASGAWKELQGMVTDLESLL